MSPSEKRAPDDDPGHGGRLLILDFDGVCFDTTAGSIDGEAERLVRDARDAGSIVAVLSNELDGATLASTALLRSVDHVVVCDSGIQKPDRRAFQRVMLLADLDADRTIVVDDSAINIRGAEAAGARAIEFDVDDRPGSWARVRHALGLGDEA